MIAAGIPRALFWASEPSSLRTTDLVSGAWPRAAERSMVASGGGVEAGERLEDALIREVREEQDSWWNRTDSRDFERIIPDKEGKPEYHYLLIDFLCKVLGGTLCAGDDSQSAAWFAIDELSALPLTEGTLEVIRRVKAFGPSLSVLHP